MRAVYLVILLASSLGAQSLVEYSGAAAGGAVGGVAGKKVSDGVTGIFNKIDKATAKAAADKDAATKDKDKDKDKDAPAFEVGPGVPHSRGAAPTASAHAATHAVRAEPGSVPPPPPVHKAAAHRPAPVPEPEPVVVAPIPEPPPPLPPVATAADLRAISVGTDREAVLKLGAPAARITMYEGGHLVEIFRYQSGDSDLGVVHLSDGAVLSVQVN
jgi:hypothetical protein